MCRVWKVHASGFYAWLKQGLSQQGKRRRRLTGLVKQSWLENVCVYGYRKVHHDLLSLGELWRGLIWNMIYIKLRHSVRIMARGVICIRGEKCKKLGAPHP